MRLEFHLRCGPGSQLGVRFVNVYWTLGEHDIVAVVEADDEESASAALLLFGGNVRTKTMRAFSRDEMRAVIDKRS